MEVTLEPKTASPPEPLAGEDCFCQDKLYVHILLKFWEWGFPDLPACGPRRGSASGPVRPILTNGHSRPSRGAKPREADDARPPQERPHQVGSRGAERSRRGKPREVLVT